MSENKRSKYAPVARVHKDEQHLQETLEIMREGDRLRREEEKVKKENLKTLTQDEMLTVAQNIDLATVVSTRDPFISQECYNLVQILQKYKCDNSCCQIMKNFYLMVTKALHDGEKNGKNKDDDDSNDTDDDDEDYNIDEFNNAILFDPNKWTVIEPGPLEALWWELDDFVYKDD